jgi:FAD/FMN-containing dehydrogenase
MSTTMGAGRRGALLRPGEEGYDAARTIWNSAWDRRPAIIARVAGAADVVSALGLGRRNDLEVAVRSGGHSIPGHSVCEGGLMIDLSGLTHIAVDPVARTARVGAGVLWGGLDAATQEHGLAVTGGEVSHTGVAGLTLGGGIGLLKRRFGLTCDNLLAAEIVTVDGEVLRVDDGTDPELMWGLRGGGGNFGVVTELTLRLHPVGPLIPAATTIHAIDDAPAALAEMAALCAEAPDELSVWAVMVTAPPMPLVPPSMVGRPVLVLNGAWIGDGDARRGLEPVLGIGRPAASGVDDVPYVVMQSIADAFAPYGRANQARSEWLGGIGTATAGALAAAAAAMTSPWGQLVLHQMGGAVARVPAGATAFARRDAALMFLVNAAWQPGDPRADDHRAWVRRCWEAVGADSTGGAYVNHLADEGEGRVRAAYGEATYARLAALKARMDPENVLRRNQNVVPAATR